MKVKVVYFAILRECAGLETEFVHTCANSLGELYAEVREKHGFHLGMESIRVACDGRFADPDSVLHEGSEVVFMPPVAGG